MILLVKPVVLPNHVRATITTRIIDGRWYGVMIYADGSLNELTVASLCKSEAERKLAGWLQCTGVGNVWQEAIH
jgi:hypothetical protein